MWVGFLLFTGVVLVFAMTRAYALQHTYNKLKLERENDKWLLTQCNYDEFYHSMRHHSHLCDEVLAKQNDNLILASIKIVATDTHLCGESPCMDLVKEGINWILGPGVFYLCCIAILVFIFPSLMIPFFSYHQNIALRSRRHAMDSMSKKGV